MSDIERDLDFELTDALASFITDLHDSEINGEISWFFDDVWGAKIGDKLNGYLAETAELPSLGHAARWLCDRALQFYPESQFAREYLRTHPDYESRTHTATLASAIGTAISTGNLPADPLSPRTPQARRSRGRRE